MTKAKRTLSLVLPLVAILGLDSLASAKEEFPSQIEQHLALGYQPPCSVCHIEGNTGSSTPRTAFALALRSRGLTGDNSSVSVALDSSAADSVDSDGDGVTDIQELKNGTDPNSSGNASIVNDQEPGYGCGGTAPHGRNASQAVLGGLGLAWALLQRRRGRP